MLRKARVTQVGGGAIQSRVDFSYDSFGRLDCTAIRMNPAVFAPATTGACTLGTEGTNGPDWISRTVYDNFDRVLKQQSAVGLPYQRDEITNAYDDNNGTLTSVTDAKGNRTTYEYGPFLRLKKTRFPSPTTVGSSSATDYEELTYDAGGRVSARRLRDGKQLTFAYDNLGREILSHPVNSVSVNDADISTIYDLLGRVLEVNHQIPGGWKTQFTYDSWGGKKSEKTIGLTTQTASMWYDDAGRRTKLQWDDGFNVTYDYDVTGQMTAIRENGAASGIGVLATFSYDDLGRRTAKTLGNGTGESYAFDPAGRLVTHGVTGPNQPNSTSFTYNPAGQIVSRTMSNDAYAWSQGVPVDRTYTTNGLNQYTASGAIAPTYDGRGNMTSAGATSYGYDSRNHLVTFGTNTLLYDGQGRLASQATPATRFLYDGSDLITESTNSAKLRRYVHGPATDEVIVWYEGAGTTDRRWLARDERGSVTRITDDNGVVLAINAYDEYGIPQTSNMGHFQYTGQTWMPELGMYYYKARIYSATMGRFMQTDPIGYKDGPNWYNYAGGGIRLIGSIAPEKSRAG